MPHNSVDDRILRRQHAAFIADGEVSSMVGSCGRYTFTRRASNDGVPAHIVLSFTEPRRFPSDAYQKLERMLNDYFSKKDITIRAHQL